jgi:DNA-binding MarR family transcriptional regulator
MDFDHYKKELEILDDMHQSYSLLFIALNKIQVEADSHLENLTLRQLMLLIAIAHLEPQEATIVNIASTLGTSKQNVNRLVSFMVKAGYLSSESSQTDKRSVNISITEEGLSVMQKNTINSNRYFLNLFKGFTKEEISTFRKTLEKLANYNHTDQKHFEKQVEIDIGKESDDMEKFLKQVRKEFL